MNEELEREVKRLEKYNDITILKLLHEEDFKEIERLANIIVELRQENEILKERLNKAANLVRKYTYSITTKEERTNRLDLNDEQYDELMSYLERSDKE